MIKVLGLLLVVAFFTMVGGAMSASLRRRVSELRKVQLFMQLLTERISYTLSPMHEIFCSLGMEPMLSELGFIGECSRLMEEGTAFPTAFLKSVNGSGGSLTRGDREILSEISAVVGGSDLENELSSLSLIKARINAAAEEAQSQSGRLSRLYSSLGVLFGIAAVVLLI